MKTELLETLLSLADEKHQASMARFAIPVENALGIPIPQLKSLAKASKRTMIWL